MEIEFTKEAQFVHQTFEFLKKALSEGEKIRSFQPRGPKSIKEGDWLYNSRWEENITKFKGYEKIWYKGKKVFTHLFSGGLYIYAEE